MKNVNILVACEYSQAVSSRLRDAGFNAFSCDLIPGELDSSFHICGDCLSVLPGGFFYTSDGCSHFVEKWDVLIAFPPCTYLSDAGKQYFDISYGEYALKRFIERDKAVGFFLSLYNSCIPHILVENPVGYINKFIEPMQIVQPWMFGDPYKKTTCLWSRNFPRLVQTHFPSNLSDYPLWVYECSKRFHYSSDECKRERSRTFSGVASAIVVAVKKIFDNN